jgi:hypothetical protein
MYVRFVVGTDAENAFWLTGVLTSARIVRDEGELYAYEEDLLNTVYGWFDEHLPCPPFAEMLRSGEWTRDAVSWFRANAGEPLSRVWDVIAILREHGTPVRMVTSNSPGQIVYSDRFQIVAETPRWV